MKSVSVALLLLFGIAASCFGGTIPGSITPNNGLSTDVILDGTTGGGYYIVGPNVWTTVWVPGTSSGGDPIDQPLFGAFGAGDPPDPPDDSAPEPGTSVLLGTGLLMLSRRVFRR